MWLIDQLGGSVDPHFQAQGHEYNDNEPTNRNDLSRYPSRSASQFLKDIIDRFETLRWLPGGLYGPESDEDEADFDEVNLPVFSSDLCLALGKRQACKLSKT